MNIADQLHKIGQSAREEMSTAESVDVLEQLRVRYLGKKGELTGILRGLKDLSREEKRELGGNANRLKAELERIQESSLESQKNTFQ